MLAASSLTARVFLLLPTLCNPLRTLSGGSSVPSNACSHAKKIFVFQGSNTEPGTYDQMMDRGWQNGWMGKDAWHVNFMVSVWFHCGRRETTSSSCSLTYEHAWAHVCMAYILTMTIVLNDMEKGHLSILFHVNTLNRVFPICVTTIDTYKHLRGKLKHSCCQFISNVSDSHLRAPGISSGFFSKGSERISVH